MPTYVAKRATRPVKSEAPNLDSLIAYHAQKSQCSDRQLTRRRNQIAQEHRNLVRQVAHAMATQCAEHYEDLEQIGMIGLMRAIEGFNPSLDKAFSSFAVPHIRGEILHHLRDHGTTVKIPRRWRELNSDANRVERKYLANERRMPTEQEIVDELNCKLQKLRQAREAVSNQSSVQLNEDYDAAAPENTYGPLYTGKLERAFKQVKQNLKDLPDSDRELIKSLYLQRVGRKVVAKSLKIDAQSLRYRVSQTLAALAN